MKRLFYTMMLAVLSLPVMAGNADPTGVDPVNLNITEEIIGDDYQCKLVGARVVRDGTKTVNRYLCKGNSGRNSSYMPTTVSLDLFFPFPLDFNVDPEDWGGHDLYGRKDKSNHIPDGRTNAEKDFYWWTSNNGRELRMWLILPNVHVLLYANDDPSDGRIEVYQDLLKKNFQCPDPVLQDERHGDWAQEQGAFEDRGQSAPSAGGGASGGGQPGQSAPPKKAVKARGGYGGNVGGW